MKAFNKRICNLLEKTTNEVVRKQANIILDLVDKGGDAATLSKILIENIESLDTNILCDADKKFVLSERHIELLETLELKNIFNVLQKDENVLKANPQVPYIISQLRSAFESKQQSPVIIAESLLNILSKFTYIPLVEQKYNILFKILDENKEDILIIKTINNLSTINKDFYCDLIESLELYVYDKDLISRSQVFEKLKQYEFEPIIKEFINDFIKFGATDKLYMTNENKDFSVQPVYSFIRIDEFNKNRITFGIAGNYYEKYHNKLTKLNEAQVQLLPDKFKELNTYLINKKISINEQTLNIYINDNKISIKDEDGINKIYLNENLIKTKNPYEYLMQSGTFKFNQASELQMVADIYENFDSLVNVDFAKVIISKLYEGLGAVLYKLDNNIEDEKFYMHLINPAMNVNEFVEDANALQIRNKLLEFMKYDISQSLYEFMDSTYKEVGNLKEQQNIINEEIHNLNIQLTKIEQAELDPIISEQFKELNLKDAISNEINKLKLEWGVLESKINKLQNLNETNTYSNIAKEDKFIVNKQIQIKSSGIIGKITAINTTTKELTIVTDEGDTVQCTYDQIELIEDTIAKNADELQAQAKKISDKETTNDSLKSELEEVTEKSEYFLGYHLKKNINESVTPKGEDQFTAYGVKDDKKAKGNERSEIKGIDDPNQKFTKDDKKVLMDIDSKVTRAIEILGELENLLEQYTKLNKKPIESNLNQLKSYKEAIMSELNKL